MLLDITAITGQSCITHWFSMLYFSKNLRALRKKIICPQKWTLLHPPLGVQESNSPTASALREGGGSQNHGVAYLFSENLSGSIAPSPKRRGACCSVLVLLGLFGCFLVFYRGNGSFWAFLGECWGSFARVPCLLGEKLCCDPRFWLVLGYCLKRFLHDQDFCGLRKVRFETNRYVECGEWGHFWLC